MTSAIHVYPNPVSEELEITRGEVKEYTVYHVQGESAHQISFSDIERGTHYLHLAETRFMLIHG